MSINAYRIKRIEHDDDLTFNLWSDEEFFNLLTQAADIYPQLNENSCGLVEISSQEVEKLRELFNKEVKAGTFTGDLKTRISEIVETMERHMQESDGWVKYYCF